MKIQKPKDKWSCKRSPGGGGGGSGWMRTKKCSYHENASKVIVKIQKKIGGCGVGSGWM